MRAPHTAAMAVAMLFSAAAAGAQSLQVTPLARDGRVLVSFRFTDAFNEDIRAAIHSGLTITFVYDVELKRKAALWLDRTVSSSRVSATVKYDTLTRRYYVTRMEDGRIERAETIDREEVAREWLTTFDKLPLFSSAALEANAEYMVRVRAHTTPRNATFVWPWEGGIAGLAKFTFIR